MAKRQIAPAVMKYEKEICDIIISKKAVGLGAAVEEEIANKVSTLTESLTKRIAELEDDVVKAHSMTDMFELSKYSHDAVFAAMQAMRAVADELETIVPAEAWPIPTYADILFSVK